MSTTSGKLAGWSFGGSAIVLVLLCVAEADGRVGESRSMARSSEIGSVTIAGSEGLRASLPSALRTGVELFRKDIAAEADPPLWGGTLSSLSRSRW